jgi:hypothetical protein
LAPFTANAETIIRKNVNIEIRMNEEHKDKSGYYLPDDNTIVFFADSSDAELGQTLIHELAHAVWYGTKVSGDWLPEVQNGKNADEKLAIWFERFVFQRNIITTYFPAVYNWFGWALKQV